MLIPLRLVVFPGNRRSGAGKLRGLLGEGRADALKGIGNTPREHPERHVAVPDELLLDKLREHGRREEMGPAPFLD